MVGLFILIGSLFAPSSQAQVFENPPIRVRLESSIDEVEIEGTGIQVMGIEKAFEKVAIPQKQKIKVRRESINGKLVWKLFREPRTDVVMEPFLALKGLELRSRGKLLPRQLFLAPSRKAVFDVVAVLPLEDYLVGVIASEMPLSWPLETLKAQAIAARSYALGTMRERAKKVFHVESTVLDQVFSHIGSGPDDSPLVAKAKEAVKSTSGMVLTSNEKVLKAYYHSDCGGRTADAPSVWGVGPSTGSAVDSSCPSHPKAHWKLQLSGEDLALRIRSFLKRPALGALTSLQITGGVAGDRVRSVTLNWETGERMTMASQDLRAALGYDKLRSALFVLTKTEQGYQFSGAGFGHGVGLCQWGARQLGRQGRRFDEILAHYYPKARLLRSGQTLQAKTEPELESRIK